MNLSKIFTSLSLASILSLPVLAQAQTASYYGKGFHGKRTASGEIYNQNAMTCASNKHKMGTRLKVTNKANGKSTICKVNDRGGFGKYGRAIDLSYGSFKKIANPKVGLIKVSIKKL